MRLAASRRTRRGQIARDVGTLLFLIVIVGLVAVVAMLTLRDRL